MRNMENGTKFEVKECVRMTSMVCSSDQQVGAGMSRCVMGEVIMSGCCRC